MALKHQQCANTRGCILRPLKVNHQSPLNSKSCKKSNQKVSCYPSTFFSIETNNTKNNINNYKSKEKNIAEARLFHFMHMLKLRPTKN